MVLPCRSSFLPSMAVYRVRKSRGTVPLKELLVLDFSFQNIFYHTPNREHIEAKHTAGSGVVCQGQLLFISQFQQQQRGFGGITLFVGRNPCPEFFLAC